MARRNAFLPRSQTRRSTDWGVGPAARDSSISATGSVIWTTGTQSTIGPLTLVRTRGVIGMTLTQATAAADGFFGAIGLGIVTDQAFTAGGASMPNPLSDADWDGWWWHTFFDLRATTATIADGTNLSHLNIEIDSKAMRKFDQNELLFGAVGGIESGSASIEFHADTRILFKSGF